MIYISELDDGLMRKVNEKVQRLICGDVALSVVNDHNIDVHGGVTTK